LIALLFVPGMVQAAPPVPIWTTDLQANDGGLISSGDPDQWAWGAVTKGPGAGFSGPNGWATRLDRVHTNSADDRLLLPPVDLTGLDQPVLIVTHWYDFEPGDGDFGSVEVLRGGEWTALTPTSGAAELVGASGDWQTDYFPLRDAGVDNLSSVRFRFQADEAVARDGWVLGELALVDGDPIPPEVDLIVAPTDTQDIPGPHRVEVEAWDDVGVESVRLIWFTAADERSERAMEATGPATWEGALPGADPGTTFVWWVEAADAAENIGVASGPSFRVFLPAPTGLTAPEGRIVSTTVPLEWTAPLTPWEVLQYTVYRDGIPVTTSTGVSVQAPVSDGGNVFAVTADFDTDEGVFEGDPSQPVTVDAYPPAILRISPASAWPGDTLNVEIQGRYLLLESGDCSVHVGTDITVLQTEVIDVDTLRVQLQVAADAEARAHTIAVRTHGTRITAEDAFEVREDATRPRVDSIAPSFLLRGESQLLRIRTNVVLPEAPRLNPGAGIVVESTRRVGEYTAEFAVTVAPDARLGLRTPEVDIGTRLLTGPTMEVRAPQPTTETLCGIGPRMPPMHGGVLIAMVATLAGWRRRSQPGGETAGPDRE